MDVIHSGDTYLVLVTLQDNGDPVAINGAAEVTAGIVDLNNQLRAGPWVCSAVAAGAAWGSGVVAVPLNGEDTDAIFDGSTPGFYDTELLCKFEVQEVFGSTTKTRRTQTFKLVKGGLEQ